MLYTCAARFDVTGNLKNFVNFFLRNKHQNQKKLVLEFWWVLQGIGFLGCSSIHVRCSDRIGGMGQVKMMHFYTRGEVHAHANRPWHKVGWFVIREKYWFVVREKYCWMACRFSSSVMHISPILECFAIRMNFYCVYGLLDIFEHMHTCKQSLRTRQSPCSIAQWVSWTPIDPIVVCPLCPSCPTAPR
jgi:hypothetical protein